MLDCNKNFKKEKKMLNIRKRKIFINNFELMASVGAYEVEKEQKQKIIIDLEIYLTNDSETKTDELNQTQDYSQFRTLVKDIINSRHFQLLEILTDKIYEEIIKNEFVLGVKVKITKPDIFYDCEVAYQLSNI
jgi:dihydroneopterin aldolase|tara:strand:+ start:2206 stop:2604 length:399 start_codon:yes stop_codon:yes gene_type:complete